MPWHPIKGLQLPEYIVAARSFYVELHHALDSFGIIRQRKALARLFPGVVINRGVEWWM